jgi:hypothetical protein
MAVRLFPDVSLKFLDSDRPLADKDNYGVGL